MNGVANGVYGGDLPNQINTPWIDFSEQSTIVGWSSFTVKSIKYKQIGNTVFVMFSIAGTSNSATTSITMPFIVNNSVLMWCYAVNNGIASHGDSNPNIGTNLIPFAYWSAATTRTTTWTASGTKQINGQFYFQI